MTAKQQLFDQVLGRLKEGTAYFSRISNQDTASSAEQAPVTALVDRILAAKRAGDDAAVGRLEAEIDEHVFRLYGLTPEEIALVNEPRYSIFTGEAETF